MDIISYCSLSSSCHIPSPHLPLQLPAENTFTHKLSEPSVILTVTLIHSSLSVRMWPPNILSFPVIHNHYILKGYTVHHKSRLVCGKQKSQRGAKTELQAAESSGFCHLGAVTEAMIDGQWILLYVIISSLFSCVWRRLLRVPWTACRSNQSIQKDRTLKDELPRSVGAK